ncbi:MAG: hypothetical protein IID18_07675 [Nitrospinae bacterium]|nr:hypothetical protein [Nitrospinota bacterium]
MKSGQNDFRTYAIPLLLLPVLIYFYFAWQFSSNIPSWDDFDFLEDALEIKESHSLGDKIAVVFSQENEHRPAFIRIIFLLQQTFSGEIDFQVLAFFGNTALLGLLFIFYKNLPGFRFKLLSLIPVVLFLFQFQNWSNMIWATSALQHFPMLYFFGGAFYWLEKKSIRKFCKHSGSRIPCGVHSGKRIGGGLARCAVSVRD